MEATGTGVLGFSSIEPRPLDLLVVDADEGMRTFLKVVLLLNLEGVIGEIREASDAEEAVEVCYGARPDISLRHA